MSSPASHPAPVQPSRRHVASRGTVSACYTARRLHTNAGCKMLFYRDQRRSTPTPSPTADPDSCSWLCKSFMTGVAMLGFTYWLGQLVGVQYLASIISITLLFFMVIYVVFWCIKHAPPFPQNITNTATVEAANSDPIPVLPPMNPPVYKVYSVMPPRDTSPPPTYEEAVRNMSPETRLAILLSTPQSSQATATAPELPPTP